MKGNDINVQGCIVVESGCDEVARKGARFGSALKGAHAEGTAGGAQTLSPMAVE